MESDLPLMDMAEEDDFLIPDPNPTPSKSSLSYFTGSPFSLPPSHTKSRKVSVHMEKQINSSSNASNEKENINSNNAEMPKLGMEPLQMKRRKKDVGYNLRKSIAWDRAFFTEKGILDPLELTLITGIDANTCGGGLPTISEEGNSSFSSDTGPAEEAPRSHTSKENREKVTHKILSVDRSNRVWSKVGGYSEPLATSSLKRPSNLYTLKSAKKESKVPKLPMSKPESCFSATSKGSIKASQIRRNLIPKPNINVEKNVGLKNSTKNVYNSESKPKTGSRSFLLPDKEVAQKTVRNLINTSKEASLTKPRLAQRDKANRGSENVPNRLQLCETREASALLEAKDLTQHIATNSESHISDRSFLYQDPPAAPRHMNHDNTGARPSGLRMPSPSLRFFDQRTASESSSLQQKNIYQCSTNIGYNSKIGPRRTPMKSNDIKENICSAPSSNFMTDILETKDKFALHNEQNRVQSHTAISTSITGPSIHHQEQDGVDDVSLIPEQPLAQVQLDFREIAPLIHDRNQLGVNMVVQCASTCPQSLENERLDIKAATTEAEIKKIHHEIQKSEELGILIGNLSKESTVDEKSLHSHINILESNPTVQGCTSGSKTYPQLKTKKQTLEDAKLQLLDDDDILFQSEQVSKSDESCSFLREVSDIGQVSADNDRVIINDRLSPENVANLDGPNNAMDTVIVVSEQSINHGNVSDLNGDYQPSESQGFVGIIPLMEINDYFTNRQSGYGLESCGQQLTIGTEGSKVSIGQEVDAEIIQQGKSGAVDEFLHELDGGSDLKENKDTTMLTKRSNNIKRQDNSLVIHPPNAVPFSDEWLEAIEAAGEEVLTLKCGAVQHSPLDKSLPEPSPWSPVKKKANEIGPYDCTKYTNAMPSSSH